VAVSRRSGTETSIGPLSGDFRPFLVSRDLIAERPLRGKAATQFHADLDSVNLQQK
jgi:hypothetical protein